jgi:hypothetical protein
MGTGPHSPGGGRCTALRRHERVSLLCCDVVAPPSLERVGGRRDRAAQSDTGPAGVGGSGAVLYESRDHRHAAGLYRSRIAQPVRQAPKRRASFEDLPVRNPDDLAR